MSRHSPQVGSRRGLAALEAGLGEDLTRLGLPRASWTARRDGPDGTTLHDVLVIGGGQFGIGLAAALKLAGIPDTLVIDRAEEGSEGPWTTFARMPTLRSPKHLPGICFGIPRLTFQSWYRARFGDAAWGALYKIPNAIWQDYIGWVRRTLDLPVWNGVEATRLEPAADHVAVMLSDGTRLHARHVVVATGRGAVGGQNHVAGISPALGPDRVAHTSDEIDFERLRGKRVAVVGVGASAFDNAATAMEAGAASVDMLARRHALPQLNKGRPSSGIGFLEGWAGLPDADRWRLAVYLDAMQGVPPHETVLRALERPGLSVHFATRLLSAKPSGEGLRLEVENGPTGEYDFLILGTGFRVDLSREPLFDAISPRIALWRDTYMPPDDLVRPHLGLYPYLGDALELKATEGPPLDRIHLFNAASWLSAGAMALDMPSLDIAPARLVTGITRALFAEDFEAIFASLCDWQDEHELEATPFYAPRYVNETGR
ncbi:cation diffusion facilitator CzcD-associated flavoprotein CzcO [Palleronia aestuarii]|uniref:Cation diffusion facilitator CzcD-associated flavoprotein CzcO n=1 Tax=Palleronia aestuarii TaxID=568105 RepID=A0A2W7NCJ4_9RHOB|nr:NAD(P)/FAD-dependent oxidoreductase [Palleronia aestuarii]PZX14464.1 cation diffusion facilitator CzcD-associated flavoprotein CzcO [Palleronia aestuarii]